MRMPGILENLDLRLREAEDGGLGYLDFLILLIQDEVVNRDSNILSKRLKVGGLSPRMTFENFNYRFNMATIPQQTIRDLATCRFIRDHRSLVLCGPPGIGKTHIAQAIGHEVCRRGGDALFVKTQKLLECLTDDSYPRRAARLWKQIKTMDLLVLDDFGFRRYTRKNPSCFMRWQTNVWEVARPSSHPTVHPTVRRKTGTASFPIRSSAGRCWIDWFPVLLRSLSRKLSLTGCMEYSVRGQKGEGSEGEGSEEKGS